MYLDKITLFNLYRSSLGDVWYPHVIENANLIVDKAAVVAKYGEESKDNAILNIHFQNEDGQITVSGKPYFPPKEWERQTNDKLADSVTFDTGNDFSFFMLGEYPDLNPIADEDYNGFFEYVVENYDFVFAVTSVAMYKTIPHFEITGK